MAKRTADHPVNEKLPIGKLLVYGLQHVLAMYAGAVTVPIVIGGALKLSPELIAFLINADLFTCGVATLIQTIGFWKFGIRMPVIQGVSFACVQPIVALGTGMLNGGMTGEAALVVIFISVIGAGLFTVLIAPLFSKLLFLFPPVVTGTVIMSIGLSLLPVAIKMMGGQNTDDYGSLGFLLVAFLVVLTILVGNRFFKGFLKNISVLLGMGVGFVASIFMGYVDLSSVAKAKVFGVDLPFGLNMPGLDGGQYFAHLTGVDFATHIIPAFITMIIVMIIIMIECTGDYLAIGEIIDLDVEKKDIANGLRADGLATMLGGVFNALPYSAFAQNVGLIAVTGVRSRWVVVASGGILVVLGLLPVLGAFFEAIPKFIIGGAAFVMFGTVAANGVKSLAKAQLTEKPNNIFIVAISIAIGLLPVFGSWTGSGFGPYRESLAKIAEAGFSTEGLNYVFAFFGQMPSALEPVIASSISLTAICAVLLNLLFNGVAKNKDVKVDMSDAH